MAYGWSDGTIALMANWGGIAQMVFFVPISFLLVRTGARYRKEKEDIQRKTVDFYFAEINCSKLQCEKLLMSLKNSLIA